MRILISLLVTIFLSPAALAQGYRLEPGDVVAIEVIEDPSLNRSTLVLPDGSINFPFAGSLAAEGRTLTQLEQSLSEALAPNFAAEPTVFVSINQLAAGDVSGNTVDIFVIGQVNAPGQYEIEEGLTFLQALSRTGGFTPFAATKRIQLRRTDPASGEEVIFSFDLRAVGDGARISGNTQMRDGDVILVPERRLFE